MSWQPVGATTQFFTREGGVSEGIYASLNCGAGSNDAPEHVVENKRRVAEFFGAPPAQLCTLYQVHSPHVVTLHAPMPEGIKPHADAMVTATPGLVLGILTADCAPVLFVDADAGVIGAAHAGWKGAVGGVIAHTISAMEALGAARANIHSAIGPCIAQASYEVGEEFVANLVGEDNENQRFFVRNPTPHFDLPGYVAARIVQTGAPAPFIVGHDTCAMAQKYFSYRRKTLRGEADYGRQISCIMLKA
jgi:YfiH family protein